MYVLEEIINCFFITTHWSYFKYNDLSHMLNVYKITATEHQVDDSWAADEISVLEILF